MNDQQLMEYLLELIAEAAARIEAKDLTDDLALPQLSEEIAALLQRFNIAAQDVLPQSLILEYFGSVDEATLLLLEAGAITAAPLAVGAAGEIASSFQTKKHLDALDKLLGDTMGDLDAAIRMAHETSMTSIDDALKAVKADLNKGVIQGNPRKVIQAAVMKSFRDNGMKGARSSDNKLLPLDFYAMTVTRTKLRDAAVAGSVNRYEDLGQDLVQIIENSDTCLICSRFKNMVVSLTGKTPGFPVVGDNGIQLPPMHPNCRGSIRPFTIQFKGEEEIKEAQQRNDKYSPTRDMRTPAQKKAYAKEQEARRKANEEKKQFARWQSLLGADAPKTLGSFRRMKRENTLKFQELESLYRSAAMTKGGS